MHPYSSPTLMQTKLQPDQPELAFILLAIRSNLNEQEQQLVQNYLDSPINWNELITVAERHKVLSLVIRSIKEIDSSLVPQPLWDEWLGGWLDKIAQRSQLYRQELVRLIHVFESAGITAISFKGPLIAEMAYPEIGLRDFADIDLLVCKEDLPKVQNILLQQNYQCDLMARLVPDEVKHFEHYHFAYLFTRKDSVTGLDIEIDLHWKILPYSFSVDFGYSDFVEHAIQIKLDGTKIVSFSDVDTLIYLCIHASKEHWKRLKMVVDLAYWIDSHPNIDWHYVNQRADELEVLQMLYLGIILVVKWIGVAIPGWFEQQIMENHSTVKLYTDLERRLVSNKLSEGDAFSVNKYSLMLMDNHKHRLRHFWRTLTTPKLYHIRLIQLPGFLRFLYIPIKVGHDYLLIPVWKIFKLMRH